MPTDEENMERFHAHATDHLNAIRKMFQRPVKMTLICREEGDTDSEVILTDDSIREIEAALERAKHRNRQAGDVIDGSIHH